MSRSSAGRQRYGPAPDLSRMARILWLRYRVEPPLSLQAIGDEYGLSEGRVGVIVRDGLRLLARLEDAGDLAEGWDPESQLGQAISRWRVRRRRPGRGTG